MYNYNIENLKPHEVLAYFRKSRTDDPTLSVEEVLSKHEAILDEWAERNLGAKIPEENKYREVVSGETIADRPEVQKVLNLIESPKFKAILIFDVQRLSRGDLEDAGRLIKLIRYTNTLVILPNDRIFNLNDEYDRKYFEMDLKQGNEFLEYQKKIMSWGRSLSVSQGNFIGATPPYGYNKIFIQEGKRKCPTLAINEEQADVVRMIYDMYVNQNMGYHTISNKLDELKITPPRNKYWSSSYIREILTNIHYTGKVRWNYRKTVIVVKDGEVKKTVPTAKEGDYLIYDGKHEPIISEELYNAAKTRKGNLPRVTPNFTVKNPFSGIIRCRCGRILVYRSYEKAEDRLICKNQGKNRCDTGSIVFSEMMDFVIGILKSKIAEFEIAIKNDTSNSIGLHEKMIESLEKKLESLKAKEISQWEAQYDPDPTKRMPEHIFQALNQKTRKEIEETENALQGAYETKPTKIDYQEKIVKLQTALDALLDEEKSPIEKNNLLKVCIKNIEYYRERPIQLKGKGNFHKYSNPAAEIKVEMNI